MNTSSLRDKIPPHNDDAERASIGAVLINFTPEVLDTVQQYICAEDFYKTAHQVIFSAIVDLFNKGEAVDILTLTNELNHRGDLEKAGGPAYVTGLFLEARSTIRSNCSIAESEWYTADAKNGYSSFVGP